MVNAAIARFEICEPRLMLSAASVADFYLDSAFSSIERLDGQIETSLADVHDAYGVSYAHST